MTINAFKEINCPIERYAQIILDGKHTYSQVNVKNLTSVTMMGERGEESKSFIVFKSIMCQIT